MQVLSGSVSDRKASATESRAMEAHGSHWWLPGWWGWRGLSGFTLAACGGRVGG